jgi:hypothetical protein
MEIAETTNALDLIPSARLAVTHLLTRVVSVESLLTNSPVWFLSKYFTKKLVFNINIEKRKRTFFWFGQQCNDKVAVI